MGSLTTVKVKALRIPGRYGDGDGLWLQVRSAGNRSWLFRYMRNGNARAMGLGPVELVSLAEARTAAQEARKLLLAGIDPLDQRKKLRDEATAGEGRTFAEIADLFLAAHDAGWKNPKHAAQWRSTLDRYVMPTFGQKAVAVVDTGDVMRVLEPIWRVKPETASRVRGRIESVLDYATARSWRQGDNPARWRGHLANLLPARSAVAEVSHHAALPWKDIAPFMAELCQREGVGARAVEFAVLTAARSGEVRGAYWREIDFEARAWNIPPGRMKARRAHRVPLSDGALALLMALLPDGGKPDGDALIFQGSKPDKPLSDMSLSAALRRMGRSEITVHGFRSTFRDWASEATTYPGELAEAALAHIVKDKTEAAYRRGDLFDRRRLMMTDWAAACAGLTRPADVVPLHGRAVG